MAVNVRNVASFLLKYPDVHELEKEAKIFINILYYLETAVLKVLMPTFQKGRMRQFGTTLNT